MNTYCIECNKEIKENDTSFVYHDAVVCWECNAELSGLNEYMIQFLANQD